MNYRVVEVKFKTLPLLTFFHFQRLDFRQTREAKRIAEVTRDYRRLPMMTVIGISRPVQLEKPILATDVHGFFNAGTKMRKGGKADIQVR